MRTLKFMVQSDIAKKQVEEAARILGCEVEVYIDHTLSEFRQAEKEEPQLDAGTINGI